MSTKVDYRDYTTIAGVKDFVANDIAPKYFPDIDQMSKLNVGLFGMVVDVESTGLFDTMQVASRYITEIIPGKSQLPEFIYAQANNFGITNLFSKCAHCEGMLMVKEEDVLRHGTINTSGISEYVISSDSVIYIDEVPFSIPYDIRIRSINIDGAYNHHCVYDQTVKNSVIDSILPYAQCVKTHVANESQTYLAITVDLYQYLKITQEENITTNNLLNIPFIDVPYSDQLCNFEAFYKGPNDTEYTQLDKLLETSPSQTRPFLYYKLVDEDNYRVSFANDDRYFVPEYNSELKIVTFETLGKNGNFSAYTGDNVYVSSADPNVPLHCVMISSSQGGDDALSLEEVRRLTWEKQLTVNSYTTDSDLNTFFSLTETPSGTTKSYFIKIRDDFTTRIIACYTRLRNEMNIFPTNTLDAVINVSDIDDNYASDFKFIVNAGARFIYESYNGQQIINDTAISTETSSVTDEDTLEIANDDNTINAIVPISNILENEPSVILSISTAEKIPDEVVVDTGCRATSYNIALSGVNDVLIESVRFKLYIGKDLNDVKLWYGEKEIEYESYNRFTGFLIFATTDMGQYSIVNRIISNTECKIVSSDAEPPEDGIEYTNIALMSLRTSPANTISYYMNSIDKNIIVTYDYLNNDAIHQFIVKTLNVKRNAVAGESSYKFTMTLLPSDLTISTQIDDSTGLDATGNAFSIINDEDKVTAQFDPTAIKAFIYIPRSNSNAHYQELVYDAEASSNQGYIFTGILETDDMVDDANIQLINVPYTGDTLSGFCPISMQNPDLKFMVFYNEGVPVTNTYENILPGVNGMRLCNYYRARENDLYFAYPMSLMESTLSYKEIVRPDDCEEFDSNKEYAIGDKVYIISDDGSELRYECLDAGQYGYLDENHWKPIVTYSFYVKNVPLFGRKFLSDENNMSEALDRLSTHYNRLQDILVDMTANFSIALRFFNTYGHSSIFSISNGLGDSVTLNRTNCDIWLSIKFFDNSNYLSVIENIKYTIKTYIESISDTDDTTPSSINKVNMSNLIKKLHDTYPNEIDYIIFNSFNGYDSSYQNIDMVMDLTLPENSRCIPEFLTLSMEDIKITILNMTV